MAASKRRNTYKFSTPPFAVPAAAMLTVLALLAGILFCAAPVSRAEGLCPGEEIAPAAAPDARGISPGEGRLPGEYLSPATPAAAPARSSPASFSPLLYGAGMGLVMLLIFLILGSLLYRLLVYPEKKIQGALLYSRTGEANNAGALPEKIILGKYEKETVMISFNPENKKADYHIQGSAFDYDLIIRRISGKGAPPFLLGWGALLKKGAPYNTLIRCSRPGIMEFSGEIYTGKILIHAEIFETGGYTFQYNNPEEKKARRHKNYGMNVLEGKI